VYDPLVFLFIRLGELMEEITQLKLGNLQVIQSKAGYRFSLDPILLVSFVNVRVGDQVVDLGTGVGVIPLLLAKVSSAASLIGVEVQPAQADRAQRNVLLNNLGDRVKIVSDDLRRFRDLFPAGKTDLVVSNPPFRAPGSGRIAPNDERAAARHELAGDLADFVVAAAWLLKHGGRLCLICLAERLPELFRLLESAGIAPKRLRMIHPRQGEPAKMVLVEGRKGGRPGLAVEAPLLIYRGAGRDYTPEVLRMYAEDEG
jgi:tRNA1Val (adenine37-N6)-methyltransferase